LNAVLITVSVFALVLLLFGMAVGVGKWLAWRGRYFNN